MTCEQEVEHYKRLIKTYRFDMLTGMKQRFDFGHETIHKMTKQKFWLAMVDVNGLHNVNRRLGYAAGDALIQQVANNIKLSDGLWECYRVGGDEFMALYFDEPRDLVIDNATLAYVYSEEYKALEDMVAIVDSKVTALKGGSRRASD